MEIGGQWVGGGDGLLGGLDLNGEVAAGGSDEMFDNAAGVVLDRAGCGQHREHDVQVALGRSHVAGLDRSGLQVVLGHAERLARDAHTLPQAKGTPKQSRYRRAPAS